MKYFYYSILLACGVLTVGCAFTYYLLNDYSKNIQTNSWEWGDINPGSNLRASNTISNGVSDYQNNRIYMPYYPTKSQNPSIIEQGEIFQVIELVERSTGSSTFYNLSLEDKFGKSLILSVSGSHPENGSRFTKEKLADMGFELLKQSM